MKLILLKPVTDGAGTHHIGSEYTCDDPVEAQRLIRLDAAKAVEIREKVVGKTEGEKSADAGGEGTGTDEFMTEEEYNAVLSELNKIDGINNSLAEKLVEEGYQSIEDVAKADKSALIEIDGIGKKSVVTIIESAQQLLTQ